MGFAQINGIGRVFAEKNGQLESHIIPDNGYNRKEKT